MKLSYATKKEWAAEAGLPLGDFLAVAAVIEEKTAHSPAPIRHAAIETLDAFLKANPGHGQSNAAVAVAIGLRENEGNFVRWHTPKLLLKAATAKGGLN